MFVITKWCKSITDDGKDQYTHRPHENMPYKFRLKDDDGIIYGYGFSSTNNDEEAFEPLDRYMNDYGCTTIEYYNSDTKQWEIL